MRTSIDLNDGLLTRAKQTAIKHGITLRELFEQALRAYLEPTRKPEGYKLQFGITHGEVVSGVPIDDWSALRDHVDELDSAGHKKRFGT
jgi:hypothetical protein